MTNQKLQSRMLNFALWPIMISWMMIPFLPAIESPSVYLSIGIITIFNLVPLILAIIGLAKATIRTYWFVAPLILSIMTFKYGIDYVTGGCIVY